MRRALMLIVSGLIFCFLLYLTIPTETPDDFRKAVQQMQRLLLPETATATVPLIEKTEWSRSAQWTIDTHENWEDYRRWLGQQLGGTYRVLSESENELSLRKTYHAEIHDISLITGHSQGKINVVYRLSLW